jgi:hypothetical protein
MLYEVRDIDFLPVNTGLLKGAIEQFAGRTDKRMSVKILLITRLLSDEDRLWPVATLAKDSLRRIAP